MDTAYELELKINYLQDVISDLEGMVSGLTAQRNGLNIRVQVLEQENAALKKELGDLQWQLERLRK